VSQKAVEPCKTQQLALKQRLQAKHYKMVVGIKTIAK